MAQIVDHGDDEVHVAPIVMMQIIIMMRAVSDGPIVIEA